MSTNNPYREMERIWREVPAAKKDVLFPGSDAKNMTTWSASSSPPPSMIDGQEERTSDDSRRLNLSAIYLSNILKFEDKNLPSVFLLLYEKALENQHANPNDEQCAADVTLLNFFIKRFHAVRTKFLFDQDVMKIFATILKQWVGPVLISAVTSTTVTHRMIMNEIARELAANMHGRTLGEYLNAYRQCGGDQSAILQPFSLFDAADVHAFDDPSRVAGPSGIFSSSFISRISRHHVVSYLREVSKDLVKTICKLKLNMPTSVCDRLFQSSVPSWAEEDTEDGIVRMDQTTKIRVEKSRANICNMLRTPLDRNLRTDRTGKENDAPVVEATSSNNEIPSPQKIQETVDEIDAETIDCMTIDTASFLADEYPATKKLRQTYRPNDSSIISVEETREESDEDKMSGDDRCEKNDRGTEHEVGKLLAYATPITSNNTYAIVKLLRGENGEIVEERTQDYPLFPTANDDNDGTDDTVDENNRAETKDDQDREGQPLKSVEAKLRNELTCLALDDDVRSIVRDDSSLRSRTSTIATSYRERSKSPVSEADLLSSIPVGRASKISTGTVADLNRNDRDIAYFFDEMEKNGDDETPVRTVNATTTEDSPPFGATRSNDLIESSSRIDDETFERRFDFGGPLNNDDYMSRR